MMAREMSFGNCEHDCPALFSRAASYALCSLGTLKIPAKRMDQPPRISVRREAKEKAGVDIFIPTQS